MQRLALVLSIMFQSTTGLAFESAEDRDSYWSECRASGSCKIEYDRLATQETAPFLFNGKIVDREHPQWGNYRRAIREYSDVRECLVPEEQLKEEPNLLLIDWDSVGLGRSGEVCLFRIGSSLGSADNMMSWLTYHEFRFSGLNNYRGANFKPIFETEPVAQITARWTSEQFREYEFSIIEKLTGYDLVYEYQFVLQYDSNGRISGVGANTPTKLN